LDSKYLVRPTPPLIVDANICRHLSIAALERNLAKHAECNPDIFTSGTHAEMVERLGKILETREMDLLVRTIVWDDEDVDSESSIP
jgi:hypothetical protein